MNNEVKKIQTFRDLEAWKYGHTLVLDVYAVTKSFPKEELFGLVRQLRRAVVSVTSNIAEGFSRRSYKEKVQYYYTAGGSLTEIQNQLLIAKDLGYMTPEEFSRLNGQAIKVHKITNGLITKSKTFYSLNSKFQIPNSSSSSSKFQLPNSLKTFALLGSLAIFSLVFTHTLPVSAQTPPPVITSVTSNVGSTTTAISFSVNIPAGGRIAWDTRSHSQVSDYANFVPPKDAIGNAVYTGAATSHSITIPTPPGALTPSTTYNYRVEVSNANGTVASANRSFTTSSSSSGTTLIITSPRQTCTNTYCDVSFGTTTLAVVQIRWDTSAHNGDIAQYPASQSITEATMTSGNRTLRFNFPPSGGQDYYYIMQAKDASIPPNEFNTGDLLAKTPASSTSHIFTTGQCLDGTALSSCNALRQFCTAQGALITDCKQCGYNCPFSQTCSVGGQCIQDPALTGSPYQCNNSSCYESSGALKLNAPAGCYASWPRCSANTVLKVKKDRGCNLWLTCSTSIQTSPSQTGPAENLCLTLAACNSLSQDGQCNRYLPQGQCSNNPVRFCSTNNDCEAGGNCISPDPNEPTKSLQNLSFQVPNQVKQIANLSGNVVVGLDWVQQGGSQFIQGYLPWQLMGQIGGDAKIKNGDMERRPPYVSPWVPSPLDDYGLTNLRIDFEAINAGPNHVLKVDPDGTIPFNAPNSTSNPGAVSDEFSASASEFFYAEARIKSESALRIRLQFGDDGYTNTRTADGLNAFFDISTTAAWQRVTIGPIKGLTGATRVGIVCVDQSNCKSFEVDDVQVKPILQVNTNPDYVTPSCRLYPKSDAPACDYQNQEGIVYKGWHGYCLEHDSQTGTCLSWWPVDIIKGASDIFGAEADAGYADRAPLYLCAESVGANPADGTAAGDDVWLKTAPRTIARNYAASPKFCLPPLLGGICPVGNNIVDFNCDQWNEQRNGAVPGDPISQGWTLSSCSSKGGATATQVATGPDKDIRETDIYKVVWEPIGIFVVNNPVITMYNTSDFRAGNGREVTESQHTATISRQVNNTNIIWEHIVSNFGPYDPGNASAVNAVTAQLFFDKTTGKFLSYLLDVNDENQSGTEAGIYRVRFYLKEYCDTFVEVVTAGGDNQAYASRVKSSAFRVPELQYGLSADLQPFGGALAPESDPFDPSKWPQLPAELINLEVSSQGQARSGTPFACNGECRDVVCTLDGVSCLKNGELDQSLISLCERDVDADGVKDGLCVGVLGTDIASNKGNQIFSDSHSPVAISNTAANNLYFSQERIRRLFTKSYGVFSREDVGNGVFQYKKQAGQEFNGPTVMCKTVTTTALCGAEILACNASFQITNSVAGISQADAETKAKNDCQAMITSNKVGCTGIDTSPLACSGGQIVLVNTIGTPYNCGNNTILGTGWRCQVDCKAVAPFGNYTRAFPDPNSTGGTIVTREPFPDDFCAVPPKIFCPDAKICAQYGGLAQFLNGTGNAVTLTGGSGAVGIKFNTSADAEQTPLKSIMVDWGDGTKDQIDFGFAPRNDRTKPHIWSHVYVCGAGATCINPISIQIRDNWGWCNTATANDHGCNAPVQKTGLVVTVRP